MLTRSTSYVAIAVALCFSVLGAPRASAQEQKPTPLKTVEVVATRRAEAPHDVPNSVNVIAGADLRARGATNLREALSLAAGIAVAPGGDQGPASAVPEIWGLREFDAFLLVVDGLPWGGALNPAIATASLRDVERIEILRGPAPVTFGATSFVGVIHVVHTAASAKARYAELHGGTLGTFGGGGDLTLLSNEKWDSRISGDLDRVGAKDEHTSYTKGHALWRLSSIGGSMSKWLTVDANIVSQSPASPHPREGAALTTKTPLDANYNPDGAFLDETRVNVSAGFERPIMNGATWGTTASYTLSGTEVFRGFLSVLADTANNSSGFRENIDINDIYVDTHIIWPGTSRLRLMAGADWLFAKGLAKGATFTYTSFLNAAARTVVPEPTLFDKDAENERNFMGAYGSAELKVSDRLRLSGGLRLNMTAEKRGETSPEASNTKLSGGIGAIFGIWEKGEDHARLFANLRSTFKPAAFDFGLAENEGILDPETSVAYEGGAKVRVMEGRVDFEASYFHMDFENLVTATTVAGLPSLQNAGSTRFQGYELEADMRLSNDVHARGTYSYHDGKFVDFVMDFGGTNTQLAGKRFEMSANTLASAGLTLSPDRGMIASFSFNYSGDRYLNKRNTALAPAFSSVDAGIGLRTARGEIRLDARNLGDARDPVAESEFGDAQYYRMTARSIRVGVVTKY